MRPKFGKPDDKIKTAFFQMSPPTNATPDPLKHAPDNSDTALLLIDVINDLEFAGGEKLLPHALPMAGALAALKRRAKAAGIPAIYCNDNFGRWRSDFRTLVRHCLAENIRGKKIVAQLAPDDDDYFILKPKHSAFFQTNLDILLKYLGVETLILTGLAGDICVLFSANDAYMRDFNIIVPPDCTASEAAEENRRVLMHMQRVLKAEITPSSQITFAARRTPTEPAKKAG
jgi:nicotinamidase-related amidase